MLSRTGDRGLPCCIRMVGFLDVASADAREARKVAHSE